MLNVSKTLSLWMVFQKLSPCGGFLIAKLVCMYAKLVCMYVRASGSTPPHKSQKIELSFKYVPPLFRVPTLVVKRWADGSIKTEC